MKTMRMRLASWLMIVCILTGVFASSICVQAATTWDEIVDGCQFGLTTVKYMLTSTFGFFTQDLDSYIQNNQTYWQYAKDFQTRWDAKGEGETEIAVTKDEVQGIYDIAKGDVTALNGYYLMNTTMTKDDIKNQFTKFFNRLDAADVATYNSFMSSHDNFIVYYKYGGSSDYDGWYIYSAPFDGYYYTRSGNAITHYIDSNNENWSFFDCLSLSAKRTNYNYCSVSASIGDNMCSFPDSKMTYLGYCGNTFKLFYSVADLLNYIDGGQPGSYQSSNFNMPVLSGNTLNIDLGKAAETDWDKVNKSIYDSVSDAITDAGGWGALDESQKQEIIDSKMDDILGSLGEIGDNTGQSNALLSSIKDILKAMQKTLEDLFMDSGDIAWKNAVSGHLKDIVAALTNISSSSKISAEHLFDIKGKVQVLHDKFSDFSFQTLIDTIKDVSGGGGGGGTVVGSTIGTVIGSLISDLIDKIQNGEETVEDAVTDLTGKFSKLADTSKTKFPFSLPWDVILIFSSLAAEPETPVFDYPFEIKSVGFRYDIHMDLKDFEKMSQLTRSFFAITFAFLLVKLTLLMINRGDFD